MIGAFFYGERLRKHGGHGAVVLVRVRNVVRVELHLVVVEVEDRRVRELAIRLRNIASAHP